MRVISRGTLVAYWQRHRDTERPLRAWLAAVRKANWATMVAVKADFPKASVINHERVVFDVCGGNHRLIVAIKFSARIVFIKFLGTHAAYDRVDAATVERQ